MLPPYPDGSSKLFSNVGISLPKYVALHPKKNLNTQLYTRVVKRYSTVQYRQVKTIILHTARLQINIFNTYNL
jgi:hypothetical protein